MSVSAGHTIPVKSGLSCTCMERSSNRLSPGTKAEDAKAFPAAARFFQAVWLHFPFLLPQLPSLDTPRLFLSVGLFVREERTSGGFLGKKHPVGMLLLLLVPVFLFRRTWKEIASACDRVSLEEQTVQTEEAQQRRDVKEKAGGEPALLNRVQDSEACPSSSAVHTPLSLPPWLAYTDVYVMRER